MASAVGQSRPRVADRPGVGEKAIFGSLGVLLLAYLVSLIVRRNGVNWTWVDGWGVSAFELLVGFLVLVRALRIPRYRRFGLVLGTGMCFWASGDFALTVETFRGAAAPTVSTVNFLWAGFYPFAYVAVMMLMRQEAKKLRLANYLDGVMAALAATALFTAFAFQATLHAAGGSPASVAINLVYPIGDALLFGLVLFGIVLLPVGRRRAWYLMGAACLINTSGDICALFPGLLASRFGFVDNAIAWPLSLFLLSLAAWLPSRPPDAELDEFKPGFLLSSLAAGSALLVLVFASLGHIDRAGLVLATATLATAGIRAALSLAQLRKLTEERHESALLAERMQRAEERHESALRAERMQRAEARRGEERLSALILNSADAIFLVDEDCRISFASPGAAKLLESTGGSQVGQTLLDSFVPDSRQSIVRQLANLTPMATGATVPLEAHVQTGSGQIRAVEGTACNLLEDTSVNGIVVTLRDVTARAELEEQLTRRALHDDLTDLPNRALFADRVAHALDRAAREPHLHVAVLFVDLDDFKAVNDGMGHNAGDELIRGVAARIRSGLRPSDTLARLGGDEFAVLVERVPSLEYANDVAQRILELLTLPIDVAGVSLAVPASVGVTLAVQGSDVESLLRDADIAMYTAKSKGKGRIEMFDETLRELASQRLALKIDLPEALRLGQFRLDYQPIQTVSGQQIVGFEALIRWHHPTRGIVSPGEFIPAAEQSGLIVEIGHWVLEQACRQAVTWNAATGHTLSMSVNVSAVQLHSPGFTDRLRNVLEATGLPPALLTIELTESVLIEHDRVFRILEELRTIGVKVAIDDFGTGYSSLSYLQKFPVTSVKVDRSFVAELTTGDPGLVRSIVSLADALGLTTIAEGVETASQLETLASLDCDLSQGFYIGYPQPPDKIDALLSQQPPSPHDPATNDGRTAIGTSR